MDWCTIECKVASRRKPRKENRKNSWHVTSMPNFMYKVCLHKPRFEPAPPRRLWPRRRHNSKPKMLSSNRYIYIYLHVYIIMVLNNFTTISCVMLSLSRLPTENHSEEADTCRSIFILYFPIRYRNSSMNQNMFLHGWNNVLRWWFPANTVWNIVSVKDFGRKPPVTSFRAWLHRFLLLKSLKHVSA